jgi:hypothetical protein
MLPAKAAPFSVGRNVTYTVPSPAVPPADQVYRLSSSWTVASSVFFSHCKPLRLSVTVPSPPSTKRGASQVSVAGDARLAACSLAQVAPYLVLHFASLSGYATPPIS